MRESHLSLFSHAVFSEICIQSAAAVNVRSISLMLRLRPAVEWSTALLSSLRLARVECLKFISFITNTHFDYYVLLWPLVLNVIITIGYNDQ